MRPGSLSVWSVLAALCVVACAPAPGAQDAGRVAVDAPSDVTDAPPDAPPDVEPRGRTYLNAAVMSAGGAPFASFVNWLNAAARPGGRCRETTTEACFAIDCRPDASGTLTPVRGVNAGDITVSAPSRAPLVIGPDIDDLYPGASVANVAAWSPGDALTFTATGGPDVPAFTVRLSFPGPLTLTSPTFPNPSQPLVLIPRAEPFTAQWTPGTGRVAMLLAQQEPTKDPGAATFFISCSFPSADGTGTIPASLLSRLDLNPGGRPRTVGLIGNSAETSVSPGGQPIGVSATHAVVLFIGVQ